jgi:hypothetical protein
MVTPCHACDGGSDFAGFDPPVLDLLLMIIHWGTVGFLDRSLYCSAIVHWLVAPFLDSFLCHSAVGIGNLGHGVALLTMLHTLGGRSEFGSLHLPLVNLLLMICHIVTLGSFGS